MERGGLAAVLTAAGKTMECAVGWADEMRIGLIGTTRRVWGHRGAKSDNVSSWSGNGAISIW